MSFIRDLEKLVKIAKDSDSSERHDLIGNVFKKYCLLLEENHKLRDEIEEMKRRINLLERGYLENG